MKKKILFVINSLGLGGAEKSLSSLLSVFDYNKYDVSLLMFRMEGMFMKYLPKTVNILPEPDFIHNNSLVEQIKHPSYLLTHICTSVGLRRNAKKRQLHDAQCYWKYAHGAFEILPVQYDVAIAWGQGNPTHYVAEKVQAIKKIAFINADYEAVGHNKSFDYPMYQRYDYMVAVSDKLTTMISDVFSDMKKKIRTIYDINNADLIQTMADISNPFETEHSELILVTVGRLVKPKGYDLAIQAARILRDNAINFKWYFVGEGPERENIEHSIEEFSLKQNIMLVGAQDNPYIYMKNADVYVQTSKSEGYCLTLGEARILNKPIVSTNFDVVYNQIRHGENGLIAEMNGEAIAEAIQRIVMDNALCNHIVENLKKEKKGNNEEIEKLYKLIENE